MQQIMPPTPFLPTSLSQFMSLFPGGHHPLLPPPLTHPATTPPSSEDNMSPPPPPSQIKEEDEQTNYDQNRARDFKCPLCKEQMTSLKEFTAHLRGHNEAKPTNDPADPTGQTKVYNCCLCGKMLSSFSSLDRHMLVHSGERPFSCGVCSQTFTTNGNMHRHRRTHNVRDSCESDGSGGSGAAKRARKRKSSTITNLMEQSGSVQQPSKVSMTASTVDETKYSGLKCPICPERFYSELSMEVHVINYHPGREIRCEDCGHPCPTYNYFKLHRNMFHFKGQNSLVVPPPSLPGITPPPPTSTYAGTPYIANLHMLMNSPVATACSMKQAPLLVPAPYSPVKKEEDLSMDPNSSFCSETLQDDDPVLKEMKLKGEFPCRLCPAVFPNLRALKGHNKEHMVTPPFVCNVSTCLYTSSDKSTLIQHMRSHTGQKPYECKICNFGFTTKANCERHVKNKHNKNIKDDLRDHIIIHDASAEDNEGSEKMVGNSFDADVIFPPTPPRSSTFNPFRPFEVDRDIVESDHDEEDAPLDLSKATNNNVNNTKQQSNYDLLDDAKEKSIPLANFAKFESQFPSLPAPGFPFGLPLLSGGQVAPPVLPGWPSGSQFNLGGMAPGFPFGAMQLAAIIAAKNEEMKKQQQLQAAVSAAGDTSSFLKDSASAALQQLSSQVRDQQLLLSQISPTNSSLSTSSPKSSPCKPMSAADTVDSYKMVIKNGVLMRKQKQRRYRTERPYGCEECKARFTLRSNMDRHMKQQHPEVYYQKPRPGPGRKPMNQSTDDMMRKDEKANSFESEAEEDCFMDEGEEEDQHLIIDDDKIKHLDVNDYEDDTLDVEGDEEDMDVDEKKLSAYSAAPQRMSCPYCARKFPWASSLERHILTHTGQKPYKCTECSLWFTTKSNCDRHIIRKHGSGSQKEDDGSDEEGFHLPIGSNLADDSCKVRRDSTGSESPYKCHICDEGFGERQLAISHIQQSHQEEFINLQAKGAFDEESYRSESSGHHLTESAGEELYDHLRGRFPDYSNRKIICLFCSRKFWSAEDLRRHVRTHTGERPYSCDICNRKFTLKHSMLRHKKKHDSGMSSNEEEASDDDLTVSSEHSSYEEQTSPEQLSSGHQQQAPVQEEAYDKKRANLMEKISRLNHNSESSC